MDALISISVIDMAIGAIVFALSGKCLTNGVDMPKPAIVGISIFLVGCLLVIIWAIVKIFMML